MTKHYGVIGAPISQSLSPNLHRAAFRYLGRDATYSRYELGANLADFVRESTPGLDGLSVTMPLKEEALSFADELDEVSKKTESCNTLVLQNQRWRGFNTDVIGMYRSLLSIPAGRVLIIGSGATSRSALAATEMRGDEVVVWSRSTERLSSSQLTQYVASAVTELHAFDLLISTIPLEPFLDLLSGSASLPPQIFSAAYSGTGLVGSARWPQASWIDGREMLLWQAVAQQAIFAEVDPSVFFGDEGLVAAMRSGLERPVGE